MLVNWNMFRDPLSFKVVTGIISEVTEGRE